MEPTVVQYATLKAISEYGGLRKKDSADIRICWELTRAGYLKNLVTLTNSHDWKFELTDSGDNYLSMTEVPKVEFGKEEDDIIEDVADPYENIIEAFGRVVNGLLIKNEMRISTGEMMGLKSHFFSLLEDI